MLPSTNTLDTFVCCTEGLNSYVRSSPAAAAKTLRKRTSLLSQQLHQQQRPLQTQTQKHPQSRSTTSSDDVVRCTRCAGIESIVVNAVERQLKGDVICACDDDGEIPQLHSDDDLDADASYQNDQLARTSTAY